MHIPVREFLFQRETSCLFQIAQCWTEFEPLKEAIQTTNEHFNITLSMTTWST